VNVLRTINNLIDLFRHFRRSTTFFHPQRKPVKSEKFKGSSILVTSTGVFSISPVKGGKRKRSLSVSNGRTRSKRRRLK